MSDKLTTKRYWETYYKHSHTDKRHISIVCSYYDELWDIFIGSNKESKHFIEIGGFPGRYLAYLSSKYKLRPTCLDYNSNTAQIEESFQVMGVNKFNIIQEDFTTYKPSTTYDYVMSNGFIEHFNDYDNILDLHVNYLNDNGRLMIMIPNMKGYVKFYKSLVDIKNLKVHNLDCMRKKVFKEFAQRHNLSIIHLGYFGGFPLGVHQENNYLQKLIYKAHRLFFKFIANDWLKRHPSRYFSSAIVAIFEKQ